ncbi:CDK5 regulatory subunit-associated protein 2 isoform X6 [Rattus norvegicus]|uniref:CDK5 regulatory subunit-associated protein 2 n=1 Tax=Rattus norvegicus TaxID=10116 RepID=A0A0G2K6K7_RAT|nr:CDK5 regulatory subunit-associated protein 2 isoform X6 [Rattus norvegicus]|eukprot:XP_006238339.1 PREDICTED: CDK5 regulatory subunit-associated protein 2 isoform X6 [Rattus norvegicus]
MMDSGMEEDVTLPGTLSGCSGLHPVLPSDLDVISDTTGLGNGVLPIMSEEKVSPTRARNMKDFENQITELKKENFNLKLRIYFLEERIQQEFAGPTEHIYKKNIELKVEVESLKRELQERDQLLVKASKAVESLAEGGGSEIQRVKEDARKKVQQVEELLTKRIHLLEEDVKAAQAELEKAFAGTETEKALRLSLESKLSAMKKMQEGDLEMTLALEEKDRLIEELKLSLKSKEALIQCLKEEKSQMASPDENVSSGELRGLSATLREEKERDAEERQKERNHFEERIQALQEDLREKEREIATEKKNSLKRDKAIQGLTMALKSKEKEVEELNSIIKELTADSTQSREAPLKTQVSEFEESENCEAALAEKEALLAKLHSENVTKNTENHRLLRNVKKVTQELNDLKKEKLRLERDLEEAHREGNRGARTIHDLRNEVEKLRKEVCEREKAVEKHYKSLPGESSSKFHSQEQVVKGLTESASQEDLLLQKSNEKDLEAIQQNCYLMTAEELKFGSDGLITEKCSQQSPDSKLIFSKEKQQSEYEGLTGDLKTEQNVYAHLAKNLQDTDSKLQAELKRVLALRKQLEQDVLAYRNLQTALQEQLSEIRKREEEPFSFYSDQTSYLSICLEEHSQFQLEHFSQEEIKKKVIDLIQLVKDLHADNQHLKKTIFDISCMGVQGNDRLESTKQAEIMEDYAEGGGKDGYVRHMDSNILDHDGAHTPDTSEDHSLEDELLSLLATFFSKKATPSLESRPDLLKALGALLLERICLAEQGSPGDHSDSKAEKALEQVAVRLRDELGHSCLANSFSKSHSELKSPRGTWLVKTGDEAKVELKSVSVQTMTIEDSTRGFKPERKREAWAGKPEEAVFSTELESEALGEMPGLQATHLSFPSAIDKDDQKTGLLIQLKTPELLENLYNLPASQEVVAQLQGQVLELQKELKEYKIRNKQLLDKLILAEAMMEGMAVPNSTPVNVPAAQAVVRTAFQGKPGEQEGHETTHSAGRDKEVDSDQYTSFEIDSEICPPDDLALLPACKENLEDFLGPPSIATYLDSKSQLSVKVSVVGTDQSENINLPDDTEALKQKIHDLQTELEGYRNIIVQLQKHSQCSEAIITVLCGTEGAQDGLNKPKGHIDEEEMTFSSLHQVRYVKHMKILRPLTPEIIDGKMLESLKQQLVEQEQELQKEQDLNLELFGEIHNLQNKFRDLSPSRYDSLVQSQARELSLQRQQIKDSHDICVVCHQHMSTMIKAFEELLQASDVDSCVAEGFREQLTQCAGLLEQLEKLFLHGKSARVEPHTQTELLRRLRTEEDNLPYQHLLPESPEPSASHALSDDEMSEKSFLSREPKPDSETEKYPTIASRFPQDLLMEHIQEIRTLRKHLEESIKTNEKLRKQLERQGCETDQGSTNVSAYSSELHNSLTSEIQFLRKQNEALSTMLEKGSKEKQKENEKLRESLARKTESLEHLQLEYASVREENERLRRDISEKERQNQQLTQEVCSSLQELSRVQEEAKSRQQLLLQKDELLQSLQMELKVYEKLAEEHQKLQQESRGEACGGGQKGQDPFSNLHGLLKEIQVLRDQAERSIQTNNTLKSKLEKQLSQGSKQAQEGALTLAVQALSVTEWSLQLDKHDVNKCPEASDNSFDLFESTQAMAPKSASETPVLSGTDVDSLSCDSTSSATSPSCMPCLVAGRHLWASKSGHHMLCLIEDYDALYKQISWGQTLLAKMDIQTQEALSPTSQKLGPKASFSVPLSKFLSSMNTAKLILEKASRLLKLFWRVSVPTNGQCSLHCDQIGEMKAEITKLHKKLFEQEKKLQNTAKLLQQSKHQEKIIFDQLVITHQVLRKARGNLELRPRAAHPGTSSPSRPGS